MTATQAVPRGPIRIVCDHEGCGVIAPDLTPADAPNGLIGLGWWCKGGRHFCPSHHPSEGSHDG